jgi:hypothetical protein
LLPGVVAPEAVAAAAVAAICWLADGSPVLYSYRLSIIVRVSTSQGLVKRENVANGTRFILDARVR